MGVISITQRSESLGNIRSSGTPKRAKTDIGTVQRARRPVYTPTFFAQHSHGGDAAIGDAIKQAAGIAIAIGQREYERQADKIPQAVMSNLDRMDRDDRDIEDWNVPDRKHLEGQKRGLLLRTGEGCRDLPKEADDSYGDTFKKIADSIGATDKQREMASERLYGYRRARQNRMMDLQSSEYRRIELDGAAGQLEQFVASWKNGNKGVLEDIFRAQERLGILKGKTEDTRKAERGNLAVVLASDLVRNRLSGCNSDKAFDDLEEDVRKGPEGFMPTEIKSRLPDGKLGGKVQDALVDEIRKTHQSFSILRDREEREQVAELSLFSANAIAKGGIDGLEAACSEMSARAAKMPKGSRLETVALQEAKRLDKAADAEAKRLTWDGILDHVGDKEEWKPPKGSRMERHYKQLKESFDRQAAAYAAEGMLAEASAVQEERKANYAALRASMLEAAAVDPGGFSARLAEAAEKGHVTLDQYRKLRDEFRDVWTKEGMAQKGAALVQILKNEFYAGRDYDLNDRLAVNPKTGRFEYVKNPDTKKPFEGEDVEFEAQVFVPYNPNSWFGIKDFIGINRASHYETETRTITSDEQLKMLDWAMELAQHDGEWISTDPQTGAKLDKPRKLDAAAEFQDACSRLRTSKRAQSSQELVLERANAMLSLRAGFAQADDAVTGAAAKREAVELKTRETLKSAKRKPFAPKMPGDSRGESAASEGEED